MQNSAIPAVALPSVAVQGSGLRFPLRRVFCVGRNYAAHSREMGGHPEREAPFFFMKPADAVVPAAGGVPYPPETRDLHHEVELVVALASGGRNIAPAQALSKVFGYAVGVDLTRRDLQEVAKKAGRPWDWAKGFDASAPVTPLVPLGRSGHPRDRRIWLSVNGHLRQDATLAEMIWPVADILALASRSVALQAGDLFFTGTPAGVGALQPGDRVSGGIDGLTSFEFFIEPPAATRGVSC